MKRLIQVSAAALLIALSLAICPDTAEQTGPVKIDTRRAVCLGRVCQNRRQLSLIISLCDCFIRFCDDF